MKQKNKAFQYVSNLQPGRSMFDLSYQKKFTCDMGQLIPIMCDECVPGDVFKISNEAVIRFQPLVAPILHEINMEVQYFFVPYRLLWNAETNDETEDTGTWEQFITGGEDGNDTSTLPRWTPSDTDAWSVGSLWDYFGFPIYDGASVTDLDGYTPMDFPRRAYNLVYNEYYRDENLQTEVGLDNEDVLNRNWRKDYFTSALPWQQKGTALALPVAGAVEWDNASPNQFIGSAPPHSSAAIEVDDYASNYNIYAQSANGANNLYEFLNSNELVATTFDVSDLRLAFQTQRWLERNARAGSRYVESLKSHFGISPRDDRFQRPEYIGGTKSPVMISEVLQTSGGSDDSNATPQGTLAGHGLNVSIGKVGNFRVPEFGLIIGLMSVMPKPAYNSQGINRQWRRITKYDFYWPEFMNLSEQAIENGELSIESGDGATSALIFGYQGRYDEMRIKHDMVCGLMRTDFDYWTLTRQLTNGSSPALNSAFIEAKAGHTGSFTIRKDIFAVPSEPGLIVNFGNLINALRPLPIQPEPGLIDHS
jgi:hypothetical protein